MQPINMTVLGMERTGEVQMEWAKKSDTPNGYIVESLPGQKMWHANTKQSRRRWTHTRALCQHFEQKQTCAMLLAWPMHPTVRKSR